MSLKWKLYLSIKSDYIWVHILPLLLTICSVIGLTLSILTENTQREREREREREQGWVANSTPGIYRWHLPVFTGLENTPQVANTGKYWQIDFFCIKIFQKS